MEMDRPRHGRSPTLRGRRVSFENSEHVAAVPKIPVGPRNGGNRQRAVPTAVDLNSAASAANSAHTVKMPRASVDAQAVQNVCASINKGSGSDNHHNSIQTAADVLEIADTPMEALANMSPDDPLSQLVAIFELFASNVSDRSALTLHRDYAKKMHQKMEKEYERGAAMHKQYPSAEQSQMARKEETRSELGIAERKLLNHNQSFKKAIQSLAESLISSMPQRETVLTGTTEAAAQKFEALEARIRDLESHSASYKVAQNAAEDSAGSQVADEGLQPTEAPQHISQKTLESLQSEMQVLISRMSTVEDKLEEKLELIQGSIVSHISAVKNSFSEHLATIEQQETVSKASDAQEYRERREAKSGVLERLDMIDKTLEGFSRDTKSQHSHLTSSFEELASMRAEVVQIAKDSHSLKTRFDIHTDELDRLNKDILISKVETNGYPKDVIEKLLSSERRMRDLFEFYDTEFRSLDEDLRGINTRVENLEQLRAGPDNPETEEHHGTTLDPLRAEITELRVQQNASDDLAGAEIDKFKEWQQTVEMRLGTMQQQWMVERETTIDIQKKLTENIERVDDIHATRARSTVLQISNESSNQQALVAAYPPMEQTDSGSDRRLDRSQRYNTATLKDIEGDFRELRQEIATNRSALDDRLEGAMISVRHLDVRMNNLSTDHLARQMISQMEALYPNLRNVEQKLSEQAELLKLQASRQDRSDPLISALQEILLSLQSSVQELKTEFTGHQGQFDESKKAFTDSITYVRQSIADLVADDDEPTRQEPGVASQSGPTSTVTPGSDVEGDDLKRKRDHISIATDKNKRPRVLGAFRLPSEELVDDESNLPIANDLNRCQSQID